MLVLCPSPEPGTSNTEMWASTVLPLQGAGEGHPLPGQPFAVGGLNQWKAAWYGTAPPSQSSIVGCILAPCDGTLYLGWYPSPNICPALEYSPSSFQLHPEQSRKPRLIHLALDLLTTTEHTRSSYRGILKGK